MTGPAAGEQPETEGTSASRAEARRRAGRKPAEARRRTIFVSTAVILALGLVLAFLLGAALRSGGAPEPAPTPSMSVRSPTPSPTPTPQPTVAAAPAGPVAPGEYAWDELGGRECLEPYESPWAERFTVVACTDPHHAQLVARGTFSDDPLAPYPGEGDLTSRLGLLCSAPEVIDYGRAGGYPDVQLQASYPPDEQSWREGSRSYFCFASLRGGGELTDSIAVG